MADAVAQIRKAFFDSDAVRKSVDVATRKALSKFGAFVRRRDQSSIRKRRAISQPNSPPSDHTGKLKRRIFFSFDMDRKSVVIGPTAFGRGEAPRLIEEGGVSVFGKYYRPRPHTQPAFEAEQPNAAKLFENQME